LIECFRRNSGCIGIEIGIAIEIDISWDPEIGKLKQTAPSHPMRKIERPADALISIPIPISIRINLRHVSSAGMAGISATRI
jgi:hypothetical protein